MDELIGKITTDIAYYMIKSDLQLVVGAGLPGSHPEHLRGIAEVACKTIMDAAVRRAVKEKLPSADSGENPTGTDFTKRPVYDPPEEPL
jgi:hypothetical protein